MKMKVIQVGLGGFGSVWTESVIYPHENLEIVGLVDVSRQAFERLRDKLGLDEAVYFAGLTEALEKLLERGVRPDIVLNVTPSRFHRSVNAAAFAHGVPVFSEKPLADNLEEADDILRLAKEAGVAYAVSQNYRYKESMMALKARIDEGVIGDIENIHIQFFRPGFSGNYRNEMAYPLLIDMAIHHFDLIRFLTGRRPESVRAESWNPSWTRYKGDANLHALFKMEGGIRVFYTGSWDSKIPETSWDGTWQIEGTAGCLTLAHDVITLHTEAGMQEWNERDTSQSMRRSLDDYMECLHEGRSSPTHGEENYQSFRMVMNTLASIQQGETRTF